MTGTVSSKRYLKPVKLFIVGMSRKFDAQWIRAIEVVLEPTSHPPLLRPLTESSEGGLINFSF
jgi:hypothetical protein